MNATRKIKLSSVVSNLTCSLCKGCLIDATTTIECIHSFCKSCIVKYLEDSQYCPVCEVQLHSTNALLSIRPDHMLQEIVYKLVPGLFEEEMKRRRQFYKENPTKTPKNQLDAGHVGNETYITSDDIIQLSLEYSSNNKQIAKSSKRYIQCSAAVSVIILKKLLRDKYDLDSSEVINIMYGERIIPDDFLLMDIAYKYSWSKSGNKTLKLAYNFKPSPFSHLSNKMGNLSICPSNESDNANNKSNKHNLLCKNRMQNKPRKPNHNALKNIAKKSKKKSSGKLSTPNHDDSSNSLASNDTVTEVELKINEEGIMRATNTSTGEERIIDRSKCSSDEGVSETSSHRENMDADGTKTKDVDCVVSKTNALLSDQNGIHTNPTNVPFDIEPGNKISTFESVCGNLQISRKSNDENLEQECASKKIDLDSKLYNAITRGSLSSLLDLGIVSSSMSEVSPSKLTTKASTASTPKRIHTTSFNGDLKFSASRLQSFDPDKNENENKRPPKFFKSRINNTNGQSGIDKTKLSSPEVKDVLAAYQSNIASEAKLMTHKSQSNSPDMSESVSLTNSATTMATSSSATVVSANSCTGTVSTNSSGYSLGGSAPTAESLRQFQLCLMMAQYNIQPHPVSYPFFNCFPVLDAKNGAAYSPYLNSAYNFSPPPPLVNGTSKAGGCSNGLDLTQHEVQCNNNNIYDNDSKHTAVNGNNITENNDGHNRKRKNSDLSVCNDVENKASRSKIVQQSKWPTDLS